MKPGKNIIRTKEIIISNPSHKRVNPHIHLMRITLTNKDTKVDFGYKAAEYYIRGGWIKISPDTFIRPKDTQQKLILTNASNIPYGPEKLHFNSTIEWRYFSLYFPPIPDGVEMIDLIEKETKGIDPTQSNFYDIRLNEIEKQERLI